MTMLKHNIYRQENERTKQSTMNTPDFQEALRKGMLTFHALFGVAIKEANWETILSQAAEASGVTCDWAPGSHVSGVDLSLNGKTFSCKSTRRNVSGRVPPATIAISSFRLTKRSGSSGELIHEIDVARNNYDSYALLLRESRARPGGGEEIVAYKVYSIPSSYLKAGALCWAQAANGDWNGKAAKVCDADANPDSGPEEGEIVAAAAEPEEGEIVVALPPPPPPPYTMKVVKTMSCQLWITVPLAYIQDCLVCEVSMKDAKKICLIDIYNYIYPAKTEIGTQTEEAAADAEVAADEVDEIADALTAMFAASLEISEDTESPAIPAATAAAAPAAAAAAAAVATRA